MTPFSAPANAKQLADLLCKVESAALEFKRSTGELREAMHTLCAFLNGSGGTVLFGVRPEGVADGQIVADQTLREIGQAAERFEPPAQLSIRRIPVKPGREVIAISVGDEPAARPFTYEGRAYERVGSTTRRMPQAKYERLLLDRAHGRRRWENEPAEDVEPRDLDRDEAYRIVEAARSTGRLVGPVGSRLADVLDRLGVRRNGKILQAAIVLFGKKFLPDYPQCELRMARFRGVDKTEFLDQRQIRGPAFKLLEEAELFCQRHFPLPGKIVPGRLQRVDTPLIPPDAMREILVNALIHRDYSIAGGAVSLAIFDDRVEVWSAGTFPAGITPAALTRNHSSVQRNPIIADVFHRAGLIEKWGRGTNRVIAMCREAGVSPPAFEENSGSAVVTFRVPAGSTGVRKVESKVQSKVESKVESLEESPGGLEERIAAALRGGSMSKSDIALAVGKKKADGQLHVTVRDMLENGRLEYTIPEKPNSRLQKYRLTAAGERHLKERGGASR